MGYNAGSYDVIVHRCRSMQECEAGLAAQNGLKNINVNN